MGALKRLKMKTSRPITITFRDYGSITIPKGVKLTHKTAMGIDENYHFVDSFDWIKPHEDGTPQHGLLHDAKHYGINVPKDCVQYHENISIETLKLQLASTNNQEERTNFLFNWLQFSDDNVKLRFKINSTIAHSLFNIMCKYIDYTLIQNIDFYYIHKNLNKILWARDMKNYEMLKLC